MGLVPVRARDVPTADPETHDAPHAKAIREQDRIIVVPTPGRQSTATAGNRIDQTAGPDHQ